MTVWSNDGLEHLALPGAPDALCGRLIADEQQPRSEVGVGRKPNVGIGAAPLVCDTCRTLVGGMLRESATNEVSASTVSGYDGRSDKFASSVCQACGYLRSFDGPCASCGLVDGEPGMLPREEPPPERFRVEQTPLGPQEKRRTSKLAVNYTLDGNRIEDGFRVVMTPDDAAWIPFLDLSRVSVSEQHECTDCKQYRWLSSVAACGTCGQLKCKDCMGPMGSDQFLGTCIKCAGILDVEGVDGTDEDDEQIDGRSLYLAHLIQDTEPDEAEELFLPGEL